MLSHVRPCSCTVSRRLTRMLNFLFVCRDAGSRPADGPSGSLQGVDGPPGPAGPAGPKGDAVSSSFSPPAVAPPLPIILLCICEQGEKGAHGDPGPRGPYGLPVSTLASPLTAKSRPPSDGVSVSRVVLENLGWT